MPGGAQAPLPPRRLAQQLMLGPPARLLTLPQVIPLRDVLAVHKKKNVRRGRRERRAEHAWLGRTSPAALAPASCPPCPLLSPAAARPSLNPVLHSCVSGCSPQVGFPNSIELVWLPQGAPAKREFFTSFLARAEAYQ